MGQSKELFMQVRELEALETFPITKNNIKSRANEAVSNLLETGNVLEIAEKLSAAIEFIEAVKKDERFVNLVREEAIKYGGLYTTNNGTKIELVETGTKYDYSGDPVWTSLKKKEDEIANCRKERETILKTISKPLQELDGETGEVIMVYPAPKSSTSSFKVTLAK